MGNKFHAKKTVVDGIEFDSKMESQYYVEVVKPGYESGEITKFELQKPYELQPGFEHDGKKVKPIVYVADFYLEYKDGTSVVIDTKGCADNTALLKRKMFYYVYPDINYIWMVRSVIDGGWCTYEYVKSQRAKRAKERKTKDCKEK